MTGGPTLAEEIGSERAIEPVDAVGLLHRRYRSDDLPQLGEITPTIALQLGHRSVRRFCDQPVADEHLAAIVAAAQSAATSSNQQSWSVVAIADRPRRGRLAHLAGDQGFIAEAPLFLVWVADLSRAARLARVAGVGFDAGDYLDSTLVAAVDAALAAQNAALAAESLGYGTVYVGAVRNRPREITEELALPPHTFPVVGLAVGRPDPAEQAGVKPRLPQRAVLHHEQYDVATADSEVPAYDHALGEYQLEYGPAKGWTAGVIERWRSATGLHGRERLREHLHALGWPSR